MKKIIGIGIAAMMVMGLAGAASAADGKWSLNLRAGVLTGTTWSAAMNPTTIGVQPAAVAATYHAAPAPTTAGIFSINPDAAKMASKDYRVDGQAEYVWNLKLQTGASWNANNTITIGAWVPVAAEATPAAPWTVKLYRGNEFVAQYLDDGQYGTSKIKTLASLKLDAGVSEDWQVVATAVPEPGSIVAMLSGLVGLAGFGIRRRK